jgi:DNA-binding transcriptional MocR family regulator
MRTWSPTIDREGGPLYRALADAIDDDIRRGALRPGDRLPPQRRLSAALGVDFTTVSRGYAEAQRRGLLRCEVGRGTFVAHPPAGADAQPDPRRAALVDMSMNLPPEPDDPALLQRMRAGLAAVAADLPALLRYQSPTGAEVDKEAASSWLSLRGMAPSHDRVAITPGAHATILAVLTILAAPGDAVLCEDVTYPGLRAIAARLRLRLVGVGSDAGGIVPDALAEAIRLHGPKALYLNPTLGNPTTLTLSLERRQEIASILIGARLPLIEDDAYGFIPQHAPAPLATMAQGLTWHVGGLAKCIGAGLRLAYTVAPDARAALLLGQALKTTAVMPSPLTAALVTRWIQDGTADHIRRFIRVETAARQALAARALAGARFDADPCAFNLWLALPPGLGRAELVGRMAGRRIGVLASDAFTVLGEPPERVRVCLGGPVDRATLSAELGFLAHALEVSAWRG